ncbi:acyl-CoA desaturase [soil metagenome]
MESSHQICQVIPARYVARLQRRHVLLCNALPVLGTIVAIAMIPFVRPGSVEFSLAMVMWALSLGVGGTVGFHRHFTHRSFEAHASLRCIFAVLGSMAAQGPVIAWVVTHRRHHEYSDLPGDPHSPQLHGSGLWNTIRGFWHAHARWLWSHDIPNPEHYAPDLLKDKAIVWINRTYYYWVCLGLVIPTIGGGMILGTWNGAVGSFLWAGPVRIFVTTQFIWSINSICHLVGTRRYPTTEESRNNFWLAVPSFGEAWHNNHHAFPTCAAFGHRWWELDLGWHMIRVLQSMRFVWDVRLAKSLVGKGDSRDWVPKSDAVLLSQGVNNDGRN